MRQFKMAGVLICSLALALLGGAGTRPAAAQTSGQVFPQTGYTVKGDFLAYWNEHGGLAQQGYPLSEEIPEVSPLDGKTYTVQYFERAVFERHPENQAPYTILLTQLGTTRYNARYPQGAPKAHASTDNPRLFRETGHTLGGVFRTYWEQHGGLMQQGFPVSDEFQETSDQDGKTYTVQYFQRAVFESHPENQAPYNVLLSQLGTFHRALVNARAAAGRLPSPPRIYSNFKPSPGAWPADPGSTVIHYSVCGAQPVPDPGLPPPPADACLALMTLTTQLVPAGAGFDVIFLSSWALGAHQHRWQMHVAADGTAMLVQEAGDPPPGLPV